MQTRTPRARTHILRHGNARMRTRPPESPPPYAARAHTHTHVRTCMPATNLASKNSASCVGLRPCPCKKGEKTYTTPRTLPAIGHYLQIAKLRPPYIHCENEIGLGVRNAVFMMMLRNGEFNSGSAVAPRPPPPRPSRQVETPPTHDFRLTFRLYQEIYRSAWTHSKPRFPAPFLWRKNVVTRRFRSGRVA